MDLILASASPRRRELLAHLGLPFRVVVADIDETPHPGEQPVPYTLRLAEAKARAVLALHPQSTVLGADTTVTVDGNLLGKPADAQDATHMLRMLSGRAHQVTTGVALVSARQRDVQAVTTTVHMGNITDAEIAAYIATGDPMDKAGAYGIQGQAMRWIPRIDGEYSNVVGLPIARVHAMLQQFST
jgi:septum formation protein